MQDEVFFKRSALFGIALLIMLSFVLMLTPSSAHLVTGRFVFGAYRGITFVGALVGMVIVVLFCTWYVRRKLNAIS